MRPIGLTGVYWCFRVYWVFFRSQLSVPYAPVYMISCLPLSTHYLFSHTVTLTRTVYFYFFIFASQYNTYTNLTLSYQSSKLCSLPPHVCPRIPRLPFHLPRSQLTPPSPTEQKTNEILESPTWLIVDIDDLKKVFSNKHPILRFSLRETSPTPIREGFWVAH